jgi:prolyl-tRNA editing enzyme YbaK/EbsC (Cys-tRNA(Pro) deacylase)
MSKGLARFQAATEGLGLTVTTHAHSTHAAEEAAAAVGAPVGAIVKSLVFKVDGNPLLVLASGPNRVDSALIGDALGIQVEKADADLVKTHTGYSIGGVPPFGHPTPLRTLMDEDFFAFDEVWAAAGSANSVFPISPTRLHELTSATVMAVSAR